MSSSPSHLSEKLQGVECFKMKDSVADVHYCSEKTKNVSEGFEHTEDMLPSSPAVKECEKMVETEVNIEDKLDGGYSWVIVCASFVNCFVVGSMFFGFSILYVEITEYFGSSKGVAGWIGSLYMASGNIFGEKSHNLCFIICYY